jgi:WD40 repeat protein/uncharacterized caspase-like protein
MYFLFRIAAVCAFVFIAINSQSDHLLASRADVVASQSAERPKLIVQLGHTNVVRAVAFSKDGRVILTGSDDRSAILWDTETGKEIRQFKGHTDEIRSVALSPDANYALTGGAAGTARLWDTATGREIRRFETPSVGFHAVALSPDGRLVAAACSDNLARVWNAASGEELKRFEGHAGAVTAVTFSPDSSVLFTGSEDNTARMWNVATGEEIRKLEGHKAKIAAVAISNDGKFALTGSGDNNARLWDAATGREIRVFQSELIEMLTVAFSPDGRYVAAAGIGQSLEGRPHLWEADTGKLVRVFQDHWLPVFSIAFSPDSKLLATASADVAGRLFDVQAGEMIRKLEGGSDAVTSITFSPDGRYFLTGRRPLPYTQMTKAARLWDTATGKEARRIIDHVMPIGPIVFSPDGRYLLTGTDFETKDKTATLWDAQTGAEVRKFKGHKGMVTSVAFSSNGRTITTGSDDQTAIVWNAATGKMIRQVKASSAEFGFVSALRSPDGRLLLANGTDKTLRAFLAATGAEQWTFEGGEVMFIRSGFSPDGRIVIVTGDDGTIRALDSASGKELWKTEKRKDYFASVAFSPDSRYFVTGGYEGSNDRSARMWETATGKEVRRFEGHIAPVGPVTFSPDGQFVLTGSWDSTTRLWDADSGEELCRMISFRDGTWAVVDREGRFDTDSLDQISGLNWVVGDAPFQPLPVEIFLREYYEPRLLARIMAGEKLRPVRSITGLNRVRPRVSITKIEQQKDAPDQVSVTVEVAGAKETFIRAGKPVEVQTGVYDLRLFRDGQMVGYAPASSGEVRLDSSTGKAAATFSNIRLPRREGANKVEFSAYAFNVDRIKSATARKTFERPASLTPEVGRAYLISVGVNAYEAEELDLSFAANDARVIDRVMREKLSKSSEYKEVVSVTLISDYETQAGKRTVTDKRATKSNFKAVLDLLAGRQVNAETIKNIPGAERIKPSLPEDLVIISFASHGYADEQGVFYLIPYDIGEAPSEKVTEEFLSRTISSDELSMWLRDADAGQMVMIVDACHSAASVESADFKPGPMGSRGLGQLAYDKGMRILTSTQADDVALESGLIKQGLMTYALTRNGIEDGQADFQPEDQAITLTELLSYAVERVPVLYDEVKAGRVKEFGRGKGARALVVVSGKRESMKKKSRYQQPSLFDFSKDQRQVTLTRQ